MPFTTESLPDGSAMVFTLSADFDAQAEAPAVTQTFMTTLGASEKPIYLIVDFRAASGRASMENVMHGASMLSRLVGHSQVCEVLMVTVTELMKMVAAGLDTPTFGNLRIKLFPTTEEALEYVRAHPIA